MASEDGGEGSSQRRPGGRTARNSEQIRRATIEVLLRDGYPSLSFATVAKEANVNRTTLYRRFGSQAELALDAIRESIRERVVFEDKGSLREDLRHALRQIGELISGPLGTTFFMALLTIQQDGELDSSLQWDERSSDVATVFDRAEARGEIAEELDREAAFAMLAGSLYFRVIVMGRDVDDAWVERTLDLYFAERS